MHSPINICNGLIAGLVSITGGCNYVENYSAFIIGGLGGIIYIGASKLLNYLKIDDPCSATQIHGFCGLWGVIAVGFFRKETGLIYTGSFKLLGIQLIGALALSLWAVLITFPYFYFTNKFERLRVPPIYEIIGNDIMMHEEKEKLTHIDSQTISIAN